MSLVIVPHILWSGKKICPVPIKVKNGIGMQLEVAKEILIRRRASEANIFSRVHATLHSALSVRRSVGRLVGRLVGPLLGSGPEGADDLCFHT